MPNIVDVIVEIPKGSQNKYVWDQSRGRVRLDRV
ncbi:MAG: Inorganic pyrophosphatase, partial [Symbiobacteriaceae bacterium]|nr:Inorganic pyrophosphatase [Symbiobacteriaceae bacterium]